MARYGVLIFLIALVACGGNKTGPALSGQGTGESTLTDLFTEAKLPFSLSDTLLNDNKDTAQIRSAVFLASIPDSVIKAIFNRNDRVRFYTLARFTGKDKATFLLVKAVRDNRKAALLFVPGSGDSVTAVLPFLVPDNEKSTSQNSTISENMSITRSTKQLMPDDAVLEGSDVFAYRAEARTFDLVMTDPLDDEQEDLVNPIDTLKATYTYAGDYQKNKRNIVSVRDGRKQGLITVFIHMEQNDGTCTGEIKGDAEIVDATTAIYRPAGDPCVLTLKFAKNSVTLEEQEGCGSKRGLECSFDGSFRKKQPQPKEDKRNR